MVARRSNALLRYFMLVFLLAVASQSAYAWWNEDWTYRKEITVDTTAQGGNLSATVSNFPVLVRLHLGNFAHFADIKPDGSDFRAVAADDQTPLPFHVDAIDVEQQMAFIWVQMPRVNAASATDKFFLYFGNPEAPAPEPSSGTYDKEQSLVYHFSNDAAVRDATAFGHDAASSSASPYAAGLIGSGVRFDGTTAVTTTVAPALRLIPAEGFTLSAWINIESNQTASSVFSLRDGAQELALILDGDQPIIRWTNGAAAAAAAASTPVAPTLLRAEGARVLTNTWTHLAVVVSGENIKLFLNGAEVFAGSLQLPELGGALTFGNGLTAAVLDEVQVAGVARDPGWLQASASSQGIGSSMLRYSEDISAEAGGGEPSYFVITMQNVTFDGWVVIVILVIMLIISVAVMILKAMLLSRIRKDNVAFLNDYRSAAEQGNLAGLDRAETEEEKALAASPMSAALSGNHDHYQSSTLYHLYHLGIAEVNKRLLRGSVGAAASRVLNAQAIDAIRATLHAANVREAQKLNAQMVLLTIAISGGPFLGLLGTVVGVMITFAAIAHSGDVDVAAIAPGTAAALAATVAGLAVAIPALFGYNYLQTRIKEIIADDEVFLDEFLTSVAEHYN